MLLNCPLDAYRTFHRWLLLSGILVYAAYLIVANDLLTQMLETDQSYLSGVILLLLLATSLDAGRRAYRLGREMCATLDLRRRAAGDTELFVADDDGVRFRDAPPVASFARQHLLLLARKTYHSGVAGSQDPLLDRLENALGRGHETGWFLADLMVRLGLLGTVIGFIFMLASVGNLSGVDIQTLQQLLANMTTGMRIALYTTLTGLGAGILLGFQYRLLDLGAERLMAEIIELSEVDVVRHLRALANTGR